MEGLLRVLATWDVIVVAPGLGNASFRGLKVQLSDPGSWCILPVSGFEQVTIPDVVLHRQGENPPSGAFNGPHFHWLSGLPRKSSLEIAPVSSGKATGIPRASLILGWRFPLASIRL